MSSTKQVSGWFFVPLHRLHIHGGISLLFLLFRQPGSPRHSEDRNSEFPVGSTILVYSRTGNATVADGTSASTPVFAGIVARLNAARFAVGKSALGFLNPWLYSLKGRGFTDITAGDNGCYEAEACCSEDLPPKQRGFHAVNGWDPASGWGSPIWEELLAAALAR